jgi:hypothetical protein
MTYILLTNVQNFTTSLTLIPLYFILGYPRNPFNDVVCNDTISASGVFTAKELWRLSKGKTNKQKQKINIKSNLK